MSVLFAPLRFVWRKRRFLIISSVLIGLLLLAGLGMVRAYSAVYAQSRIYTLDAAPESYRVAIVFGAWVRPNGRLSAMLADRVKMGTELYHAGKVEALLLTGDNSIDTYNEPEAMRQYALEAGVPDEAIILDYAGFRTYDSCYRAQAIFEVDAAILVTQAFHLDRALLTCNALGMDAIGVAADAMRPTGYARSSMFISQLREMPSTAVAVFDVLVGSQPTFLGEPLPIFE